MPTGPATPTAPRARRSAPRPAALLALLAALALLMLAGLPGPAEAEIRPAQACAAATIRDPACPAQRFALQAVFDADEPAGEGHSLAPPARVRPSPRPTHTVRRASDPQPRMQAGCPPERPPRRA